METIESKIIGIILTVFDLNYEAVFSRCQKPELVICRQTIHTICKDVLNYSYAETGAITNNAHCTAIYSYKSIQNIIDTNYQPYASYIKVAKGLCENMIETMKVLNFEMWIPIYKHSKLK